jgi:cellulose synthase/poly-beta-1,6-N-acetylglucosamine synthase-like glycosyltransferase
MVSLQKKLISEDNDYTKLDRLFKEKTGLNIKDGYSKRLTLNKSCSIIIPFYRDRSSLKRNLTALAYQDLPSDFKLNKVEIIIVNGDSSFNLKNLVKFIRRFYSVTYLKLKKNYGRATARNLGLLYSKNDIVIFFGRRYRRFQ